MEIAKASDGIHAESESAISADSIHECFGVSEREAGKF